MTTPSTPTIEDLYRELRRKQLEAQGRTAPAATPTTPPPTPVAPTPTPTSQEDLVRLYQELRAKQLRAEAPTPKPGPSQPTPTPVGQPQRHYGFRDFLRDAMIGLGRGSQLAPAGREQQQASELGGELVAQGAEAAFPYKVPRAPSTLENVVSGQTPPGMAIPELQARQEQRPALAQLASQTVAQSLAGAGAGAITRGILGRGTRVILPGRLPPEPGLLPRFQVVVVNEEHPAGAIIDALDTPLHRKGVADNPQNFVALPKGYGPEDLAKARETLGAVPPVAREVPAAAATGAAEAVPAGGQPAVGPLEQAQIKLMEARANLEGELQPGQRAPKFGTAERAQYQAERMQRSQGGARVTAKAQRVAEARDKLKAAEAELAQQPGQDFGSRLVRAYEETLQEQNTERLAKGLEARGREEAPVLRLVDLATRMNMSRRDFTQALHAANISGSLEARGISLPISRGVSGQTLTIPARSSGESVTRYYGIAVKKPIRSIPVTEPGAPEAGVQAGMMGVPNKEFRPQAPMAQGELDMLLKLREWETGEGTPLAQAADQLAAEDMGFGEGLPGMFQRGREPGGPPIPGSRAGPVPSAIDIALQRAENTGIDTGLFANYQAEAQTTAQAVSRLRRQFNMLRGIWDKSVTRHSEVQHGYEAATNYTEAGIQRINGIVLSMREAVLKAFGPDLLKGGNGLRGKYAGPATAGKAIDEYVGTIWHFLDNPASYRGMTKEQMAVARSWQAITNNELRFSQQVGLNIRELADSWVAHSFVSDEPSLWQKIIGLRQARIQGQGRAKPFFTKERRLDTEAFAEQAAAWGQKINTDVLNILSRRLSGTLRMRAEQVFLDSVAARVGGGRLAPQLQGRLAPGQGQVASSGRLWQFPDRVAREIDQILHPLPLGDADRYISAGVDAARGALLNLDFSVGGLRQGLLAFMADPIGGTRDFGQAWKVALTRDGWFRQYLDHAAEYEDAAAHGLGLRFSPLDTTASVRGQSTNVLERIPGIKQLNNVQFNAIMPILKLGRYKQFTQMLTDIRDQRGLASVIQRMPVAGDMVKRLGGKLHTMNDDEIKRVAAEAANNWLGGINWANVGSSPGVWRKLILLTEGWTRAQIGNMVNFPKLGPEGILARRLVMQEMAITAGIATVASLAMEGELPDFDPRQRFLDIKTPFGYVALMPHKTLIRTLFRVVGGDPQAAQYGKGPVGQRVGAVTQFGEGRLGQAPRTGSELLTGKDYFGNPIGNRAAYLGKQMAPIIAGQTVQEAQQGEPAGAIAARAALTFAGTSTQPYTARAQVSRRLNIGDYASQEPFMKRLVVDMVRQEKGGSGAQNYRTPSDAIERARMEQLLELPKRFPRGAKNADFRLENEYQAINDEAQGKREGLSLAEGGDPPTYDVNDSDPNKRALAQYRMLGRDPSVLTPAGRLNSQAYQRALTQLRQSWSPEQQKYVLRNSHTSPVPLVVLNRLNQYTRASILAAQNAREAYLREQGRSDLTDLSHKLFFASPATR